MGLGAMMAGGNPAEGREENDFYPTPPEVTRSLLKRLTFGDRTILEPAAGNYMMAAEIERAGYKVIASDIEPQDPRVIKRDFFTMTETEAQVVITNPPFNLAERFITHSLEVLQVDYLALVLKSTYWHAKSRVQLFNRLPPVMILPLTWRVDFMNKGRPTMDCSWMVWKRGYTGATRLTPLLKY